MTFAPRAALLPLLLLATPGLARAAPAETPPPEAAAPGAPALTAEAINGASFVDWQGRQAKAGGTESPAGEAKPDDVAAAIADATGDEKAEAPAGASQTSAADEAKDAPDPFLIRLQVLLDRAHASPGVVDGLQGSNTAKAIRAFERMRDMPVGGEPDEALWAALSGDAAPAVHPYTITPEDVAGPFVPDLPKDYGKLAKLQRLGYRDAAELLAERFHMDEDLLRRLNPGADFATTGTQILVADPGAPPTDKVSKIVVDKSEGEILAYREDGTLVLVDPATIGSPDNPSPSGTMKVNGVAHDPTYRYDPSKNFKQGDNKEKLTLPPGPNGPVGSVWIDLAKPTYGIHGTPDPDLIDKSGSHGCVRLANWDAEALAALVQPAKTVVEFRD